MGKILFAIPLDATLSDTVIRIVSDVFKINASDMFAKGRSGEAVRPRQVYFYILKEKFFVSPSSISRYWGDTPGTDRATIIHGAKACYNDTLFNKEYRDVVDSILSRIQGVLKFKTTPKNTSVKSWIPEIKNHRSKMALFYMMTSASRM